MIQKPLPDCLVKQLTAPKFGATNSKLKLEPKSFSTLQKTTTPHTIISWEHYRYRYYRREEYESLGLTIDQWREINWILDQFN